jgi:hypothetical protein
MKVMRLLVMVMPASTSAAGSGDARSHSDGTWVALAKK